MFKIYTNPKIHKKICEQKFSTVICTGKCIAYPESIGFCANQLEGGWTNSLKCSSLSIITPSFCEVSFSTVKLLYDFHVVREYLKLDLLVTIAIDYSIIVSLYSIHVDLVERQIERMTRVPHTRVERFDLVAKSKISRLYLGCIVNKAQTCSFNDICPSEASVELSLDGII